MPLAPAFCTMDWGEGIFHVQNSTLPIDRHDAVSLRSARRISTKQSVLSELKTAACRTENHICFYCVERSIGSCVHMPSIRIQTSGECDLPDARKTLVCSDRVAKNTVHLLPSACSYRCCCLRVDAVNRRSREVVGSLLQTRRPQWWYRKRRLLLSLCEKRRPIPMM